MEMQTIIMIAILLIFAGAVVGILAGLFGVGGGAVSVPVLYETFGFMGLEEGVAMPLAVGTSLAIIIPTSLRSAWGHYQRGAVDTKLLRIWVLPIILGVLAGTSVASFADPWVFQLVFVAVASVIAIKLFVGGKGWRVGEELPSDWLLRIYGLIVGALSALMGIGGGAISNLILTLHGKAIHQAIATSAGVGVLISIPGTIGYIIAGWGKSGLPVDALGYVSLLGFVLLVPTSFLTARTGVYLAHAMSRRALEIAFGLFLLAVAARFLFALST
ncbi:hypothetical protein DKP76_17415 [Falsochrobactrum shanghaiense]|uniref:Probable membrane transporter protein n=2 Tax=Falsochrobactrum shanghaiense TaxID=2201899 RepID=A0A316J3F6_9HYPH|nr:hypothetical protein DKP76_17415 [Falsochrobactrum shanghaiense]